MFAGHNSGSLGLEFGRLELGSSSVRVGVWG